MSNVENLEDHMAFSCKCGCVRFNLLKSGGIECDDCGEKIDSTWGLAQPAVSETHKQEPVAFKCGDAIVHIKPPIYGATPPQRTWVHATPWRGLTDEEANELVEHTECEDYYGLVEATEAKLKEKNTK